MELGGKFDFSSTLHEEIRFLFWFLLKEKQNIEKGKKEANLVLMKPKGSEETPSEEEETKATANNKSS